MTGTVTLYSQTHFNGVDIPANPTVVAMAPVVSVLNDVYFERMDVDLDHIDLKIQYSAVRDVDYIKIHNNQDNLDFYYRAIPTALAKGTTRMSLQLDALLTLGGADSITYISGWQERGHIKKTDDVLFGNIATESWVPSQQLVSATNYALTPTQSTEQIGKYQSGSTVTYTQLTDDLSVVVSNIDVSVLGSLPALEMEVIEGMVSGATDASMYLPAIKTIPANKSTEFRIHDYTDTQHSGLHTFTIPNTAAFMSGGSTNYTTDADTTRAGLEKLYSAGQLQLQASYQIPKGYVGKALLDGTKNGLLVALEGVDKTRLMSEFPYEYTVPNYTVKNKKVFATFRSYSITALASGDLVTKMPYELYKSGDTAPTVRMWSDPCSTGKPYCRFEYIKSNPIIWQDAVKGLQWQSSQVVIEGASGSLWNSINTAFSNQQIERSKEQMLFDTQLKGSQLDVSRNMLDVNYDVANIKRGVTAGGEYISGGMNAFANLADGNIGGFIDETTKMRTNLINSGLDTYQAGKQYQADLKNLQIEGAANDAAARFAKTDAQLAINQNGIELLKNNRVVAPSVSFTPEQNLGLYGYNYFVIYEVRKTDEDLKSEDMYYQRYGYSGLHRPLTNQCFKERTYYNFVQAFDINLRGLYNMGSRIEAAAIAQLNGGVRVWRTLPDPARYEDN